MHISSPLTHAYSFTLDHDYFAVSPEDQYVADSKLKVTQISEDEKKVVKTCCVGTEFM